MAVGWRHPHDLHSVVPNAKAEKREATFLKPLVS
jgi:hypothetical protein